MREAEGSFTPPVRCGACGTVRLRAARTSTSGAPRYRSAWRRCTARHRIRREWTL